MATSLKNRNFLKLLDYTPAEIQYPVSYTHLTLPTIA